MMLDPESKKKLMYIGISIAIIIVVCFVIFLLKHRKNNNVVDKNNLFNIYESGNESGNELVVCDKFNKIRYSVSNNHSVCFRFPYENNEYIALNTGILRDCWDNNKKEFESYWNPSDVKSSYVTNLLSLPGTSLSVSP